MPTPPSTTNEPVVVLVLGVATMLPGVNPNQETDPLAVQIYVLYPSATVTIGEPVTDDGAAYAEPYRMTTIPDPPCTLYPPAYPPPGAAPPPPPPVFIPPPAVVALL